MDSHSAGTLPKFPQDAGFKGTYIKHQCSGTILKHSALDGLEWDYSVLTEQGI